VGIPKIKNVQRKKLNQSKQGSAKIAYLAAILLLYTCSYNKNSAPVYLCYVTDGLVLCVATVAAAAAVMQQYVEL